MNAKIRRQLKARKRRIEKRLDKRNMGLEWLIGIFLEKFGTHQHASRMAFRVGQCYYKDKSYKEAGQAFDDFNTKFHEDELCPDAMFWAGESYRLANNNFEAFRRYQNCRYDYPSSEPAKYARGRLALPEMLQQFEADVNSLDQP